MTDFLKNLKESLETGVPSEAVKSEFREIVNKADKLESSPGKIIELRQQSVEAQESRKPLTKEEIRELEFQAIKQQQKIDEFEFKQTLNGTLINIDLVIEKLTNQIKDFVGLSVQLRNDSIPLKERKELMKKVIVAINKTETPVELSEKLTIGNDDVIYGENGATYGKVAD